MKACFFFFQFPFDTLIPDGKRITWDSRKGFIISNATYKEIGLLTCETTVNGHEYKTNYLTLRQSKWCSESMSISRNTQGFICLMKRWFFLKKCDFFCLQPTQSQTSKSARQAQSDYLEVTLSPSTARPPLPWTQEFRWPGVTLGKWVTYFSISSIGQYLVLASEMLNWVFEVGESGIFWLLAVQVNKEAVGLVWVLPLPDISWVW